MSNGYDSVDGELSPLGPRTSTLADREYNKRLLNKPLKDEIYQAVANQDKAKLVNLLTNQTEIKLQALENRIFVKLLLFTAIEDDNVEILEILLKFGARVGGILFTAIRQSSFSCVQTIVEFLETKGPFDEEEDDINDLGPGDVRPEGFITPMMMAIQLNDHDIIEYLITKGYQIDEFDYDYDESIKNQLDIDLLRFTSSLRLQRRSTIKRHFPKEHSILFKINTYQALANPLYITYLYLHDKCQENPLFKIFHLGRTLTKLSSNENEFKEEYHNLYNQCEDFAVDLMEQCRTFHEINFLTDITCENEKRKKTIEIKNEDANQLTFLNMAIKGNNDKLVAHPYSQLCLNKVLYKDIYTMFGCEPNWRDRSFPSILLFTLRHIILLPFLACAHIIIPSTKVRQILGNPMVKFMSHIWSMFLFVVLLVVSSFQDTFDDEIFRPGIPDWLIMAWTVGLIFQEFKELAVQGKRRYFSQWWNTVTFIMVLLFTFSYILRLVAYGITGNWVLLDPIKDLTPSATFKVILLSNSLFSVGMVLSFIRISAVFQSNDKLGPLQLSLYYLILDVAKFMVFFALIIVAFGFSLRKLYSHYISTQRYIAKHSSNGTSQDVSHQFSNAASGFTGLFWSLFGLTELDSFSTTDKNFLITKQTGEILFGLFQVFAVIIAVNMLIAMMTRSFDDIADNAIKKWKVSRTRLWMFWVEKGSLLPPPLNLIPNARFIYKTIKKLFNCCNKEEENSFVVNEEDDFTDISKAQKSDPFETRNGLKHRKIKEILKRYVLMRKNRDNVENKTARTQPTKSFFETKGNGTQNNSPVQINGNLKHPAKTFFETKGNETQNDSPVQMNGNETQPAKTFFETNENGTHPAKSFFETTGNGMNNNSPVETNRIGTQAKPLVQTNGLSDEILTKQRTGSVASTTL